VLGTWDDHDFGMNNVGREWTEKQFSQIQFLDFLDEAADSVRRQREGQALTLVHFSAQLKRFLLDRGCMYGLFKECLGGDRGYEWVCRVYFVSATAQVELRSGRV